MKATTLIAGAGYTGRRVLDRLPDAYGLSRSADHERARKMDIDSDGALPVELADDWALIYTVPPATDSEGDPRLERFLEALPSVPARIVYLSTTGVYGDRGGEFVDESAAPNPETGRAQRRVRAETLLADWCRDRGSDLVVLRVPGIYGPGRLGVGRIRLHTPVIRESDANPGNRIHVDDLAECCVRALDPTVPAGIYNVGDGDDRSSTWFATEVARQAGLDTPPTISRDEAEKTFSAARLSFLRESRRIDTTRMREILEPQMKYADPVKGIGESLQEEAGNLPT